MIIQVSQLISQISNVIHNAGIIIINYLKIWVFFLNRIAFTKRNSLIALGNCDFFLNRILLPVKKEQEAICDFLNKKNLPIILGYH